MKFVLGLAVASCLLVALVQASLPAKERDALVSLYESAGGKAWTNSKVR